MVCVCYSPNKNVQFCPVFPIFFFPFNGRQEKSGRWILQLAASSQEQRSEWFNAFAPFSQGAAQ